MQYVVSDPAQIPGHYFPVSELGMENCRVETLENGTQICSLHKHPLADMSALDLVENGEFKPLMTTLYCSIGNTQFTAPYTMAKFCFEYRLMLQDEHAAWTAKNVPERAEVQRQMREHLETCKVCEGVFRLPV